MIQLGISLSGKINRGQKANNENTTTSHKHNHHIAPFLVIVLRNNKKMVFYNFGDFLLVSFPISLFRLLHNFKVAKANKKGARLLNFSHFPGEMV